MEVAERVRGLVTPLAQAASLDLYDVEYRGAVIRVLVDAHGGVGVDRLARLSRSLSRVLDAHDPVGGRYTLEVSSPGLERPLRTVEHFRQAVGEKVKLKTIPGLDGPRHVTGTLSDAGDRGVEVRSAAGAVHRIAYGQVLRARTIFEWGPAAANSQQKKAAAGRAPRQRQRRAVAQPGSKRGGARS